LSENYNRIIKDKYTIEVVNGRPVTYRLIVLNSQNSGYRHIVHLIFIPTYFVIEITKEGHIFVTGLGKGLTIILMVEI